MGTMQTIDAIGERRGSILNDKRRRPQSLTSLAAGLVTRLACWSAKRRSRRALRELGPDQLSDIGLTPSDVRREAAKSFFWD